MKKSLKEIKLVDKGLVLEAPKGMYKTKEELQKWLESPAYFINNYVRILDRSTGNWIKPNPITDEQIANVVKSFKFKKRIRSNPYEITKLWFDKIKELYGGENILLIGLQDN